MKTSYCEVFSNYWYRLGRSITSCSTLVISSFVVAFLAMVAWNATKTSPTNFTNAIENQKCSYTLLKVVVVKVLELGMSKKWGCKKILWYLEEAKITFWALALVSIWFPLKNPPSGVSTFGTWFKGIGFLCSRSSSYYNKYWGGDTSWNSKGAFGILENKFCVGFFFFFFRGWRVFHQTPLPRQWTWHLI